MIDPLSMLPGVGQQSSIDKLVSIYMAQERKPLNALKASRDRLDVRFAMFDDLRKKITDVKTLATDLASSASSVFSGHIVTSSDSTKATATASTSATNGTYSLSVTALAKTDRWTAPSKASSWRATASGSFTINGVSVTVTAGVSTLASIRDAVNAGSYATGKEVVASVVNDSTGSGVLVVESKKTGAASAITINDTVSSVLANNGLSFTHSQTAVDASFTVNGVPVSRSGNAGLSDVVSGLTIDLKDIGATTLTVSGDTAGMSSKINAFLDKLNALFDHLKDKSAATKSADGNYTRGPLYGYARYTDLRSVLASDLISQVTGLPAGGPTRLSDLGITMDSSMHFVVSDSTKLNNQLSTNPSGVAALFGGTGGVAQRVQNRLTPYVVDRVGGAKAYATQDQTSITSQQTAIDGQVKTLNDRLAMREKQLRQQFARMQSLLISVMQQQQRMQSIFSPSSGWGF